MSATLMFISAAISIVFLLDFAKTIFELQRDRLAMKLIRNDTGGFSV